jgi:nitrate reductase NapE component
MRKRAADHLIFESIHTLSFGLIGHRNVSIMMNFGFILDVVWVYQMVYGMGLLMSHLNALFGFTILLWEDYANTI